MAEATGKTEKIRVLIVDDIPETRENLRKLLFFEPDIEVVGAATSGEESVAMAAQLKPDVILMDINMPGIDGITATEMITQQLPWVQVIMMSVQGETDYLRRSMQAGAREFLIKPFTSEDLVAAIRRIHQLGLTRRPKISSEPAAPGSSAPGRDGTGTSAGRILTVFSPKGGTGCSTLAINLAVALAQQKQGNKVALVDASLQFGDVAVLLNLQASRSIVDLVPHVNELDGEMLETVLVPHGSGVKALLAPPRPELADQVTPPLIERVLTGLRNLMSYVVVDTNSIINDITLTTLDLADRIVLVTTPDIPSIKDAKLFFEVADALEYPSSKTILILNKSDPHSGIRAEDIQASIKHPIVAQLPLDERTATLAANHGVPYMVGSARTTKLAQATASLAQYIANVLAEKEETTVAVPAKLSTGRLSL
ncbi:MAG: histidine kinase [Ardenticatenia bacterium]|jgi:pilus assembly protein CpaE|nr:MAG: histidine kinase [Ardenticatenia bacterium]